MQGLCQIHQHRVFYILTTLRTTCAMVAFAKHASSTQAVQEIGEVHVVLAWCVRSAVGAESSVFSLHRVHVRAFLLYSECVIGGALLGVFQGGVCSRSILELFFCIRRL